MSVLSKVLQGKTMTVTEATQAVRAAGYQTKAKAVSLYHAVAVRLAQHPRFRRVGRGRYRAR